MTNFATSGFLSEDEHPLTAQYAAKHNEIFEKLRSINNEVGTSYSNLKLQSQSAPMIYSSLSFLRILQNYQTCIILCEKGLEVQCEMILRSALESTFNLAAVATDPQFFSKIIRSYDTENHKAAKSYLRYKTNIKEDDESSGLARRVINRLTGKTYKVNARDAAVTAGLENIYDVLYTYTSGSIHGSLKSLERNYLINDINEKQLIIEYGPRYENAIRILFTLTELIDIAWCALCRTAEHNITAEYKALLNATFDVFENEYGDQLSMTAVRHGEGHDHS